MAKDTVEGQLFLDVRYLNREGKLRPGLHGLRWTRSDGEPAGSITLKTEQDRITLMYSFSSWGSEPEQVDQIVSLTWTPAHFGGRRPWFVCGNCGRRVAILYAAGKYFACRKCYDLTYRSCQESNSSFSRWLNSPAAQGDVGSWPDFAIKQALKKAWAEERRLEKAMTSRRKKKRGGNAI